MKHRNLGITLLFVIVFTVGYTALCTEKTEKVKAETKETTESVKDYTFEQRTEFIAKMKSELAKINKQIDKLSEKVEKASGETKTEAKAKLQTLRDKAAKLNKQIDEANNTTETNWSEFKVSCQKAYGDVKESFNQSRKWLSEKIAP